jgi:hypothetical protein
LRAVAIAIVVITAVVVVVATIRATPVALSVLAKLTRELLVCSQPCLPDVAAIVVAAPPAIIVGVRLVTEAPLAAVVATDFSKASTLVASRPRFF